MHWLVTKFWNTGSVHDRQHVCSQIVLIGDMLCNAEETQPNFCRNLWEDCPSKLNGVTAHIVNRTAALLQEFSDGRFVGYGYPDLQTSYHPTSLCRNFTKKVSVQVTHEAWRNWNMLLHRLLWPIKTSWHCTKHTKTGGCMSLRRLLTYSASAGKLLCKFL
jgi:hypothetical protein